MPKNYILFMLLSLTCLIISCKTKSTTEQKIEYATPAEEKLDSVTKWFNTEANFENKNYLPRLNTQFNKKIETKKWDEAAQLLFFCGGAVVSNRKADTLTIKRHIEFLKNHESQISDKYRSGLLLNLANLHYYNSQLSLAIPVLEKIIKMPHHDYYTLRHIALANVELSYNYHEIGKVDKSLTASFSAIEDLTALKDTLGMGASYDAIAGVYQEMEEYDKAEEYYNKSIAMLSAGGDDYNVFTVYINKLQLYESIESPKLDPFVDSVFNHFELKKEMNDYIKSTVYSWKASKLLKEKKIKEAAYLFGIIKPIFDQSNEQFLFTKYMESAALYDQITGSKTIDIDIYQKVIPIYKANKTYQNLLTCYSALAIDSEKKNDFKNALFYTQEYNKISDSVATNVLKIKTKELEKKYQSEKKEQQIVLQASELVKKNSFITLLIISLIGLLLAFLASFLWKKQKQFNKEKENSINFTKQLLENTEEERKRIAGDLHDSISHELLNLKSFFKKDFSEVNTKIDSIINDIRDISRNLHPVMFEKLGLVLNIEQLVERAQIQDEFFISTEIDYSGSLSSSTELQIYRIIQEGLTNITKYANAHAAKLEFIETPENIKLVIKDNGQGFNVKEVINSGKAFGLHNILERSRLIGGEVNISSTSKGTVIIVNIPKKS